MFPARAPQWAAQIIFDNGDAQFFDSPLSLFLYLSDVGRYTHGRSAEQIVVRYAKDFNSGRSIESNSAHCVAGSSDFGPMRAGNFPAFFDDETAQRFAQQHGGQVVGIADLAPEVLQKLSGRARHAH